MRHLDLFSGIGGFALAASWMNWQTVGFCEKDSFAGKVIKKHWPEVPFWNDIRKITEPIECDIITGGFPCQSFSTASAGHRSGKEDDRYLWPEMLRVIALQRPTWVVAENVTGIIGMALDTVLADLEHEGYSSRALVIPAGAVDAAHKRSRVWIVGRSVSNPARSRLKRVFTTTSDAKGLAKGPEAEFARVCGGKSKRRNELPGDSPLLQKETGNLWRPEPSFCRVANGIPRRVDRLRALGNAIVPQVAFKLFEAIEKNSQ